MTPQEAKGFSEASLLPPLRHDLQLLPASRNWSGEPRWTIHDPLRNRFIQISEHDFHLLHAWHLQEAGRIVAAATESGVPYQLLDLLDLYEFLLREELLSIEGTGLYQRFTQLAAMRHQSWWQILLHNYVFFQVPLLHPDRLLNRLYVFARFFVQPWFVMFSVAVGALGLFFIIRSWSLFIHSFSFLFSLQGALVFGVTLSCVKVLHELGHGLMAKHYGLKVPVMGVAFIVMWPVLYTDATDSWRLVSRRQRAMISAAGVITEMLLACYAMFLWVVLPDGIARSVAFTVATTTWLTSALVNLNPLMRFDGYYLWSDIFNVPNLQNRSLLLFKRYLHRWLFGVQEAATDDMSKQREYGLLAYAIALLHYRFFLYLGIAVLVYHYAFKALGIVLFCVEAGVFVAGPIYREVRLWPSMFRAMSQQRRMIWLGGATVLLLLLFFPWRASMELPAVLSAQQQYQAFAVQPAQVGQVLVKDGDRVSKGQLLITLNSPDLTQEMAAVEADITGLMAARDQAGINEKLAQNGMVTDQQLMQAQAKYASLQQLNDNLQIRAPFDGTVRDLDRTLRTGLWIGLQHPLLMVVGGQKKLTAWASEKQMELLQEGSEGYFYAESADGYKHLPVRLVRISRAALSSFDSPYQASVHGGGVPVRQADGGKLVPVEASFELEAVPLQEESPAWQGTQRGRLHLEGRRQVPMAAGVRWLLGAILRESGF